MLTVLLRRVKKKVRERVLAQTERTGEMNKNKKNLANAYKTRESL